MFSEDETHRDQAKVFLLDFLQRWRIKSLSPDQKKVNLWKFYSNDIKWLIENRFM